MGRPKGESKMRHIARLFIAIFTFVIVIGLAAPVVSAFSGSGGGTAGNPYIITTVGQLQEMKDALTAYYVLGNDIDASATSGWNGGHGFVPIGNSSTKFTGSFNGNGHVIYNLYENWPDNNYVGLFGYTGSGGRVENVGLENENVSGGTWEVGGLVGYNGGTVSGCYSTGGVNGSNDVGGLVGYNGGTVSGCYSAGRVNSIAWEVGGLVGYNDENSTLSNCYSMGFVSGGGNIGGLVGLNYGTVSGCYSTGGVNGSLYDVGGLVGCNGGTVSGCYSTGSVSGSDWDVGGLVGYSLGGTVSNCYSTGSVTGGDCIGGLVGYILIYQGGTVSNCYSTGSVTGSNWYIGGLVGCNGGTVSGCYSTGGVNGGSYYVGGLVGRNDGTVENCYSTENVSGSNDVGGLVGRIKRGGTVSNCYSTGSVSGNDNVGGLVGLNDENSTLSNCYSMGFVSGNENVGGLVGWNEGTVSGCYSTGSVSGSSKVGGFVGLNEGAVFDSYSTGSVSGDTNIGGLVGYGDGSVSNSFWDNQTSGQSTSDGGTGKTTENMKTVRTYTDNTWSVGLTSPWDFVGNPYEDIANEDIWNIYPLVNDGYPFLAWAFVLPPTKPTLTSPGNWAIIADNTPTFEWTSVSDPSGVTYQIQVDDNDDFGSPVYYAVDLTAITHTLPDEDALALGTYYWHVRAKDGAGNVGDWSEERNFTVVPIGAIGVLLMPLLLLLPFALILWRQNRRYP